MLDSELKEQLRSVFAPLENQIDLVFEDSAHQDQPQLLQLLEDVKSTSEKIIIAMGEGAKVALTAFEDRMYG